ncbi:MAG: FAD-dependent oxidoreductase, partial [Erysipelotrichaceae bacterium]|nr:FAD-dependent oxidoreductase [Erysipelotrichaceae bacterium]
LSKIEELGVSVTSCGYDYSRMLERKQTVVDSLRGGIEKGLKGKKITVVNDLATVTGDHTVRTSEAEYEAENILICSGSVPSLPPIEGIELAITSDDILEKDHELAESIIIIGGGVIGLEVASVYLNLGRQVTILEMADQLIPNMDKELATRISMFLKKKGAVIVTKAAVRKIENDGELRKVTYADKNGNEVQVTGNDVLCAAGRRANVSGLFENVDVEINRGIVTDENYRTAISNIYAIGDCRRGNVQLAHVAMAQAVNVIDVICGREKSVDEGVIPSCIYTDPEMASVGLIETEAKEKGIEVIARKTLTGANGKCMIEQADSGYVKLVIDKNSEQIIGAQLICPDATNMIGELAVAVQKKMTVSELKEVIHPHPTVVEMIADCL